jgi:hypothetical protein
MPVLEREIQSRSRLTLKPYDKTNPGAQASRALLATSFAVPEFHANEKSDASGPTRIPELEHRTGRVPAVGEDESMDMLHERQTVTSVLILNVILSTFLVTFVLASLLEIRLSRYVATFLLIAGLGLGGSTAGFVLEGARKRSSAL